MMILFLMTLCLTSTLGLADVKETNGPSSSAMPLITTSAEMLAQPVSSAQTAEQVTAAISCYVCTSKNDTACFDEKTLRKDHIHECHPVNGQQSIGCWRLEQWVIYDETSELKAHDRIIRGCAYKKQEHACIYRSGFGGMISHCLCNSTACNSAMTMSVTPINAFFVLFSTLLCIVTIKSFF
ncbi:hypothetical protein DERF_012003 [Dermatophagoides farinae]|uniref:Protein sleepless n=1 Tax=Dermatophagoides farinae TaxID=6954 RepID=A0A922KZL4_DERFA|nr:hypothetical protein DERF_012003 [Dermatophagoides farinae]